MICSQSLSRHGTRLAFLARWDEELFAFLHYLLERHCLNDLDAGFGENFYGLRRVVVTADSAASAAGTAAAAARPANAQTPTARVANMGDIDRRRALFFLVRWLTFT